MPSLSAKVRMVKMIDKLVWSTEYMQVHVTESRRHDPNLWACHGEDVDSTR